MLNMAPQHEPYYYHGPIMLPAAYIPSAVVQAQLPQAHVPMVQQIQQQFMCSVPGGYPIPLGTWTHEHLLTWQTTQTQKLLLRCDSMGDLYPVTQQPSL
ncbi:hypothetical protein Tco_0429271 [Tanacetum coccineum]